MRRRRTARRALAALPLLLAGCISSPPPALPEWQPIAEPAADSVQSVLLLVGDAGYMRAAASPLPHRLRVEVEAWSSQLRADSAVVVLWLGDNVYPEGLHSPGDARRQEEAQRLAEQAGIVGGPNARRRGARSIYIAGNHDWGIKGGAWGLQQLRNQEALLDSLRRSGPDLRLLPRAGTGGPAVVDVGDRLRLLLIDSAWWLLTADPAAKSRLIEATERALREAGRREVVVALHHPWRSGGPHGGLIPFWQTLGIKNFLRRSGALLQDLNSRPARDLRQRLQAVFRATRPPLVFAAGHEHSLQVLQGIDPGDPAHILVSGSGSKSSGVGWAEGQRFRSGQYGYMRLLFLASGGVTLSVLATPDEYAHCSGADESRRKCLAEGASGFRPIYSARLK